jgi:hypothetical protein
MEIELESDSGLDILNPVASFNPDLRNPVPSVNFQGTKSSST